MPVGVLLCESVVYSKLKKTAGAVVARGGRREMRIWGWRVGCAACALGGARALFCPSVLGQARASGLFTAPQLAYLRATGESRDARDVCVHRSAAKLCAATPVSAADAARIEHTRRSNNALLHALDALAADGEARAKRRGRK